MKVVLVSAILCVTMAGVSGCRRRARDGSQPPAAAEAAAPAESNSDASAAATPRANAPAPKTDGSVELNGVTYTFANDPASVLKRAKATYTERVDKFYENRGRFPTSLAEAGLTQVPLPPGRQASYNPATGIVTIK